MSLFSLGFSPESSFLTGRFSEGLYSGVTIKQLHFLSSGHIEWKDKGRKQCLVMWRTPEEWGNLIHNWVSFVLRL